MSSTPKWARVIDENNKTSAIIKAKNLPSSSSNSSIRVLSLSSIRAFFQLFVKSGIISNCYIALSVSDKKSLLESIKTLKSNELEVLGNGSDDFSSNSSYDQDSSSEDEIYFCLLKF